MLERRGDLIVNGEGNPVALIREHDQCILVNRMHWNDRKMRTKVSELAGGVKKHIRMPHEVYMELLSEGPEHPAIGWRVQARSASTSGPCAKPKPW